MMDTNLNDNAAFEAHMTAVQHLQSALRRDVSPAEVACVLAKAYGDALAIAGYKSGSADLVAGINALANDAYQETLAAINGGLHPETIQ